MVTSRDVARAAGVSQATVSRVLTSANPVSAELRERVLAAVDLVGYVPHAAARTMKTGRTGAIGAVVDDLASNPFYPELLQELSDAFDDLGQRLTVWTAGSRSDAAIRSLRQGLVDGVVFTTVTPTSTEFASAVDSRLPLVLINRTLDDVDCDQISTDNVAGGALVADRFAAAGRRPAFIGGPADASTSRQRLTGFRARLTELGAALPPAPWEIGDYTHDSAYRAMQRIIAEDAADAVFCANDVVAVGALDAAREVGARVPDDLWIIGYDDIALASWTSIDLSTVRQDARRMARDGARMLLERIRSPSSPVQHVRLEPELVTRGTSGR
ncbi:LacI family DNA-binding transcriptional regulator [Microlunatus soli]|uniref:Transcriptional regulator, LacI family n=1 Tax=Microlunatus soli TaxID=630515 RepID=A0A1H1RIC5_9ACTN|nr:LacI family DNA-binding transcriptional regulator [Microlunatus soli]SDS35403.1 transcriptional regulator, LacI family [Microlunatus soli]